MAPLFVCMLMLYDTSALLLSWAA